MDDRVSDGRNAAHCAHAQLMRFARATHVQLRRVTAGRECRVGGEQGAHVGAAICRQRAVAGLQSYSRAFRIVVGIANGELYAVWERLWQAWLDG